MRNELAPVHIGRFSGPIPKSLLAWANKEERVVEVSRDSGWANATGWGYQVVLAPGWSVDGCHAICENTVAEVISAAKRLSPCFCRDCAEELARA